VRDCIEDISNNIKEGAEAFVEAEMRILLPATVTLCLVVFVLTGSRGAKEILQSPIANAKPVSWHTRNPELARFVRQSHNSRQAALSCFSVMCQILHFVQDWAFGAFSAMAFLCGAVTSAIAG